MNDIRNQQGLQPRRRGFTLIELLVVIAIIALLIGILVPALGAAKAASQAIKCGTNIRIVGQAVNIYVTENRDYYPPAYVYPDASGNYDFYNQNNGQATNGYLHWSYLLFSSGRAPETAFQCPTITNGGAPRTNPGTDPKDWELPGEMDGNGNSAPAAASLTDRQARRMAFTGNAAIFGRNKFTLTQAQNDPSISGAQTYNQFVKASAVEKTSGTILATEFHSNWKAVSSLDGGSYKSRSHRPINPFYSISGGYNEYSAPAPAPPGNISPFQYPSASALKDAKSYQAGEGFIDDPGTSPLNAVGRNHRGGDSLGGTSNFVYCDGHVERKTILTTLKNREWGNAFYSLQGAPAVN